MSKVPKGYKQTEVGVIPVEWEVVPVESCGEVDTGKAKNPRAVGSMMPYLRVANVFDGEIDVGDVYEMPFTDREFERFKILHGDVLLNEGQTTELVGRCSIYRGELGRPCAIQNALIRFRAGSETDSFFAEQYFRWCQISGRFSEIATQTTSVAHLGLKRFASMRMHFPPLSEQKKIAEILTGVDETIEATRKVIDQTKKVKQGLLQELLTKGIGHQKFKDTEIGRIPVEWEVVNLNSICGSMIDGPFGSNLKTEHYVKDEGVRVVRLKNIRNGRYDDSDRAFVSTIHAERLARHKVAGGDILVAGLGDDSNPIGRACLYPPHLPDAINKADCYRLRVSDNSRNDFVVSALNSNTVRIQVDQQIRGVTRKRITLSIIREVLLPHPPLPEQKQIAAILSSVDDKISAQEKELAQLQTMKKGLMQDLLTGRVRVKV